MFGFFKKKAINLALAALKERIMSDFLEGIGVINELSWKNRQLHLQLVLNGLENQPLDITATDMEIAPDASSITVHSFQANMPFAEVALNRFATRSFAVPEGKARLAMQAAKKALGI